MTPLIVLASLCAGVSVGALSLTVWRLPRRLAPRLDPYTVAARVRLGDRGAELEALLPPESSNAFARVLAPMLRAAEDRLSRWLGHRDEAATALALEHAGMGDVTPRQFRDSQLAFAAWGVGVGLVSGAVLGMRSGLVLGLIAVPYGFGRKRIELARRIATRRAKMRAELWQVCPLLAIRLHASLNIQAAIAQFCAEAHGEVADELRRVLIAAHSGTPAEVALRDLAPRTAEQFAARLYRTLADGIERGGNLSHQLLNQAADVRNAYRNDRLARSTRRTMMMVGPALVMAMVVVLLVGAPILHSIFSINH